MFHVKHRQAGPVHRDRCAMLVRFPSPRSLRFDPMTRIVAIANQKGGVGKTTTAINVSSSVAAAEKRALVVDMDPQANLTSGLGIDPGGGTIYRGLVEGVSAES